MRDGGEGRARLERRDESELVIGVVVWELAETEERSEKVVLGKSFGGSGGEPSEMWGWEKREGLESEREEHRTRPLHNVGKVSTWSWIH